MSLFDVTGIASFIFYTAILLAFIFWWSFIEEENLDRDRRIAGIDPLRAFGLFVEVNLWELYLLGKKFRFYMNEALLLSVLYILTAATPPRRINHKIVSH